MSAANLSRFVIKAFDYDEWSIVVEATDADAALRKAEAIYLTDGFGPTQGFELCESDVAWKVHALVEEVRR
jgi:hypothetical protein